MNTARGRLLFDHMYLNGRHLLLTMIMIKSNSCFFGFFFQLLVLEPMLARSRGRMVRHISNTHSTHSSVTIKFLCSLFQGDLVQDWKHLVGNMVSGHLNPLTQSEL